MARHIERRDILLDSVARVPYPFQPLSVAAIPQKTYSLRSLVQAPNTISDLRILDAEFACVKTLVRAFLDTSIEGRTATRSINRMPALDPERVTQNASKYPLMLITYLLFLVDTCVPDSGCQRL